MFGLFKKKEQGIEVTDKVVIDQAAKLATLLEIWKKDNNTVLVFWFEESLREAAAYFTQQNAEVPLLLSHEVTGGQRAGRQPVFAEHYPLRSKEEALFEQLQLDKVTVYSSLREPLFKQFGADKIIELMQQLGMKEDTVIENSMVTKAIRRAQEKIEEKTSLDQSARSQADWIRINYTA